MRAGCTAVCEDGVRRRRAGGLAAGWSGEERVGGETRRRLEGPAAAAVVEARRRRRLLRGGMALVSGLCWRRGWVLGVCLCVRGEDVGCDKGGVA